MTLQQLEYVLTIAEEGSITKAAARLFKAQPNISSSIRELEKEIGIKIFERSSNGTHLTPEGESFFIQANNIVLKVRQLKEMFHEKEQEGFVFRISISKSSYLTSAISKWLGSYTKEHDAMQIYLHETNINNVIESVARGDSTLGIVRVPIYKQDFYEEQLTCHQLIRQELIRFPLLVCMKKKHPLCRYKVIPYEELVKYTEIIHGDDCSPILREDNLCDNRFDKKTPCCRQIHVSDRGSQTFMLNEIPDAYTWVPPVPRHRIERHNLELKECTIEQNINIDMVIFRKEHEEHEKNAAIQSCVTALKEYSASLLIELAKERLKV